MGEKFAKVGDNISGQHPTVFELIIEDHVEYIDPADYGLIEESINPASYFITSGDAVEKSKILVRDLLLLHSSLSKKLETSESQGFRSYIEQVLEVCGQAQALYEALKRARGVNCFLETEWENHRLLCIPKNPRLRE